MEGKYIISINDAGFTLFVDGLIVFDCPIARAEAEPEMGVRMLKYLHETYTKKGVAKVESK